MSRLFESILHDIPDASDEAREEIFAAAKELGDKLRQENRAFNFSDLPERLRKEAKKNLFGTNGAAERMADEFRRCFDLSSTAHLIRAREGIDRANASLVVREDEQVLWRLDAKVSGSGTVVTGEIENMVLVPAWKQGSELCFRMKKTSAHLEAGRFSEAFAELLSVVGSGLTEAYYLPAARSGIIQSHRVIASSVMARATRAVLDRASELPTLPGPLADFMQLLIDHRRGEDGLGRASKRPQVIQAIADDLEERTLGGEILIQRQLSGVYPEFLYRQRNATKSIGFGQASSMVTELAPLVLFLRGCMGVGDTLIVEEPEAHLHPAAQTEMANTLARLVNAGVRVVATTHSDWLLKAFGNLIREGELNESTGSSEDRDKGLLRPEDVGVWLLRKESVECGSTVDEIPFDRISGIEPLDYDEVAEELYNRSAELQNRFAEAMAGGATG